MSLFFIISTVFLFFLFVNNSSRIDWSRFCSKYSTQTNIPTLFNSGGVLKEVLGLEDTFWSPWRWPQRSSSGPRSLQVLENALSSAEDSTIFWIVKMGHGHDFFYVILKNARKFVKTFFFLTTSEILRKIFCFLRDYFFSENTCASCALSYASEVDLEASSPRKLACPRLEDSTFF